MTTAAKPVTPPTTPVATPDLDAPVDEPGLTPIKKRKRRSSQHTIFDDGGPSFRIYQVVGPNQKFPQGTLLPIDGIGGFRDAVDALNGIKKHAELLVGKQVMVLRGVHIVSVEVESQPRVKLDLKPHIRRPDVNSDV